MSSAGAARPYVPSPFGSVAPDKRNALVQDTLAAKVLPGLAAVGIPAERLYRFRQSVSKAA